LSSNITAALERFRKIKNGRIFTEKWRIQQGFVNRIPGILDCYTYFLVIIMRGYITFVIVFHSSSCYLVFTCINSYVMLCVGVITNTLNYKLLSSRCWFRFVTCHESGPYGKPKRLDNLFRKEVEKVPGKRKSVLTFRSKCPLSRTGQGDI